MQLCSAITNSLQLSQKPTHQFSWTLLMLFKHNIFPFKKRNTVRRSWLYSVAQREERCSASAAEPDIIKDHPQLPEPFPSRTGGQCL